MQDHFNINVSLNGRYLFDTGEKLTSEYEAKRVYALFEEKFPESEGYSISVSQWESRGKTLCWKTEKSKEDNTLDKFTFRDKITSYQHRLENDIFTFDFGDGEFTDSEENNYFLHFEYHMKINKWIIEIWWEDDNINIFELFKSDADEYITREEIEDVKRFIKSFLKQGYL